MSEMSKRLGVADVKAHLSELIRELERQGGRVVIERRGRPVAVLECYEASRCAEPEAHWASSLDGIAAGITDFDSTMVDVIRSREEAQPRPIDLDD